MGQLNVGDKVNLKEHGIIGWECQEWTRIADLQFETEYTISIAEKHDIVVLEEDPKSLAYHPGHFSLVNLSPQIAL